ncbi:hypothetical protein MHU86_21409 [Fragilaria crotonensis]|nr:hypothetical protein MHU86_21409 [Fragilaria crotonensis]
MRPFSFGLVLLAWLGVVSHAALSSSVTTTKSAAVAASDDDFDGLEIDFSCTLSHSSNSDDCWKNAGCVWCQGAPLHGICVSQGQADALIRKLPGVECSPETQQHSETTTTTTLIAAEFAPYDPVCLAAGMNADGNDEAQEQCDSTLDANGNPCVWCDGAGVFGLCLNQDQAKTAGPYLSCDSMITEHFVPDPSDPAVYKLTTTRHHDDAVKEIWNNPLDPSCVEAAWNADDAEATCHATVDQEGTPCVWCSLPGEPAGVCLNADQSAAAGQYLSCNSHLIQESNIMKQIMSPYDISCAIVGYTSSADDAKANCVSSKDMGGDACVWCTVQEYQDESGVCLNQDQSNAAHQWLMCTDPAAVVKQEAHASIHGSPYDVTCALAGFTAGADGESVCGSTVDQEGIPCEWCPSGGICLTHDQSNIAEQVGMRCGISAETLEDDPYDITCAIAGYTAGDDGETVCKATQDEDGDMCVWCSFGGQGLCLTEEQSQIAQQLSLDCDAGQPKMAFEPLESVAFPVASSQFDLSCVLAGVTAGPDAEHACLSSFEQSGGACIWCPVGGLCLTDNQVGIAHQAGVKCFEEEEEVQVQDNPLDVTCAMAAFHAGSDAEEVCKSTKDMDGDDCVWCTLASKGVCLTDYQASVASKMQIDCEEKTPIAIDASIPLVDAIVSGSPYDVTCVLAGYTAGADGESVCGSTVDQDGDACVWCSAGGLCLTHDQVDFAEQAGVQCGSTADILEDDPYDITCAIAGYTAGDDGETVCKATQDEDGDTCVWCSFGGQGLCLTEEQSQIAQQLSLNCDASSNSRFSLRSAAIEE